MDASGTVSGTGFGEAQIEAAVAGFPWHATARVIAGRFRVKPAIQLLSPTGPATGALTLYVANADGTPVDLQGHASHVPGRKLRRQRGPPGDRYRSCAPAEFQGLTLLQRRDWMARLSNNASFTRVTTNTLGLSMSLYTGEHVAFQVADQVGPYPYGQLMDDLQVVDVTDHAYRLEQWLTGTTPFNGDTQFLVMDPGYDADGTVPCGLSGNPLRLGVGVDNLRSCFGGVDWLQWGIMYHELGHNFMVQQPFFDWLSGLTDPGDYSEGMATMLGVYAIDTLVKHPDAYGLTSTPPRTSPRASIPLTPAFARTIFYAELAAYEQHPDYASSFTADILDGILTRLHDEYGLAFLYRLLSAFVAGDEWRDLRFDSEDQRLTFWVAACSAAATTTSWRAFRDTWGFPVDDDFYAEVYPLARRLVARRDPATDAGQDNDPVGAEHELPRRGRLRLGGRCPDPRLADRVPPRRQHGHADESGGLAPDLSARSDGALWLSLQARWALITGPGDTVTVTACVLAPRTWTSPGAMPMPR